MPRTCVWMPVSAVLEIASVSSLNLNVALNITLNALAVGREIKAAPLTVAVLDAGGHLISLQREDGASLLRPQIAIGKAWGRWPWARARG